MSIKEEFVEIIINARYIKYWKNLGYIIPIYFHKTNGWCVKRGTKILVKVSDLPKGSEVKITAICNNCGKERILYFRQYRNICNDCYLHSEENRINNTGKNNPMFGKESPKKGKTYEKLYGEEKAKLLKGEHSKKIKGKKQTRETIRKKRIFTLNKITENKEQGFQITPFWNPIACDIIEQYGNENNFNFQTARSGNEYRIEYLGYFLDGYDTKKNVAIEIYEPYHYRNKEQMLHDIQRQKEIQDYLYCDFIIIKVDSKNNILETKIYDYSPTSFNFVSTLIE